METWVTAISTLGFPIVVCIWFAWKTDKDKKDSDEKIEKKDKENRMFTSKLVDNLTNDILELKKQRESDKEIINQIVNTNNKLGETNAKLYSSIDNKMDSLGKKVDKIEIIVERLNNNE